jgi:hypothetical protein
MLAKTDFLPQTISATRGLAVSSIGTDAWLFTQFIEVDMVFYHSKD